MVLATASHRPSATLENSKFVLLQPTSGDSVATYLQDHSSLKQDLSPTREQASQAKANGCIWETSESAEADPLLDEKSPWAGKILLTLDGGGVRGLSTLYILQALMRSISQQERKLDDESKSSSYSPLFRSASSNDDTEYLPCHYFDYIGGTSTGGLIAIMLGRLRMSVEQTIKVYTDLSETIFRNPSNRLARHWTLSHKRGPRQRKLKEKFDALSNKERGQQFLSETRDQCQTIVCTLRRVSDNALGPILFRSYEMADEFPSRRVNSDESSVFGKYELRHPNLKDLQTSEVAQAATAAPSFAKPIKQEFDGNIYSDATWTFNNPTWVLYKEIAKEQGQELECLVSIGCGRDKMKQSTSPRRSSFRRIMDSSKLDKDLRHQAENRGFYYYRLDVEHQEERVRLDEWKPKSTGESTVQKIKGAAEKYLAQENIKEHCRDIAYLLVQRRVQRANTMRWELFASGTWYVCPERNCPDKNPHFENRNALLDHLRDVHDYAPPDAKHYDQIQDRLNEGRKKGRSVPGSPVL